MLYVFLIVLIVLAAVIMCFVVCIQESKGGGLASSFSSSNAIFGVRNTKSGLENITWFLAAFMVVISILAAYSLPSASGENSVMTKQATESSNVNPNNIPAMPSAPAQNAPAESAPAQNAPAK
ncbi:MULTISPECIES: preprotein translocase subunit SecG [unclassified Bacteroides]|jgi:preprotein translocase subunit SecG|uniref:preprotein translocase subunit SecG n=1 Tax=unclassified Bacteroides TaxID=2646097 RepID=UPI0004E1ED14|nr:MULTISPECIES: preprotein translocase subunit SecG [unclassified Bacteroides]